MSSNKYQASIQYIRAKVNQLLGVIGTLPLRPEELDDDTLIELDPIGIISDSFKQILEHLNQTNLELKTAQTEIRVILDAIAAAVLVVDGARRIEDLNSKAMNWFFGSEDKEIILGARLMDVCHCDINIDSLLSDADESAEFVFNNRYYHLVMTRVGNENQDNEKRVLLFFDITEQKQVENDLKLYERVFNNTAEGIIITDSDTRIIGANEAASRITGYPNHELMGLQPSIFTSGLHDEKFYREMWSSLKGYGFWKGEVIDRTKAGGVVPLLQTISAVKNSEGDVVNYISVITDMTSYQEVKSELNYLAHHDVLTSLPNRLLFNERLEQAIAKAQHNDDKVALLFVDLDRFKNINDSLGHVIGDKLLIQVAKRIKSMIRSTDTVSRLGGDEFVVLIQGLNSHVPVEKLAKKVVQNVRLPYQVNEYELHIGCSIGIALYPEDGGTSVELLKNADAAMYKAKEMGRDQYSKFNESISERITQRLQIENKLRSAIKSKQFELHYQPIVDLDSGKVISAEALIRWRDENGDYIFPDRFIPIAEETNLINPIGAWVLDEALRQFSVWKAAGISIEYISVNFSGVQIFSGDFVDEIRASLSRHNLPGEALQVEITENILMSDAEYCATVLGQLRESGIRIAIDDFGTGYSSLAYLKRLPIDYLKIDRSFVNDIPDDANDCAISSAIIKMSDSLGIRVIAEGVENKTQERYLYGIGCNHVQGYYYSRPVPPDVFEVFLASF